MLTDRFIAGLPLGTAQKVNVFDANPNTRGLVIRVGVRMKTWFFSYQSNGTTRWLKLGEYPSLGLADARTRAKQQRRLLDDNLDPVTERQKALEPPPAPPPAFTFADFVPVFVNFQKKRTRHWEDEHSKIKRYLLPAWGTLPLAGITRRHVTELLDAVEGKGLTVGVNRIQAVISRMFTVAIHRDLLDAHPAIGVIRRFKELPRDRVLTDDELRTLWEGLDTHPCAASDAIRFRLLLGQRGLEIVEMAWSEIDLERAVWTLPLQRTKTQQRTHIVPLPATAQALLERRRQETPLDEPRVFPGLTLNTSAYRTLRTIHAGSYEWKDLRRTAATRLAELGFGEDVIGRTLNHAKHSITSRHYNRHQYVDEIRQALNAWDAELQRIIRNEPKIRSRVLPMRPR